MKKEIAFLTAFCLGMAFAAAPEIVDGSVSLTKGTAEMVKIAYTLTGEPAVVTIDIQTNTAAGAGGEWVSIGGEAMGELGGEANKVVRTLDEPVTAYWFPSVTFRDQNVASGGIRAEVRAWPTNCPPDYMTVDLTAPTSTVCAIRFYTSTNALPGGFTNLAYKTTTLLMRKIPAAGVVWWMCTPTDETNHEAWEQLHKVMLTDDYYAAVYETTQAQYKNINGSLGICAFTVFSDSPLRPFQQAQLTVLRGQVKSTVTGYWPENGHTVTVSSVIGKLRQKCGIADIDLPTEAQWEYACRAGTGTALPSGKSATTANLNEIAWRGGNVSETVFDTRGNTNATLSLPHVVGTKQPNNWGLYDMIGNVFEFCLDRSPAEDATGAAQYASTFTPGWDDPVSPSVTTNPAGYAELTRDVGSKRGGGWLDGDKRMRSGSRCLAGITYTDSSNNGYGGKGYIGFRLFCSVKEAAK